MPVSLLSFLFALLQLLQPLGEHVFCDKEQPASHLAIPAKRNWNTITPEHILNILAEVEESDESNNPAFGQVAFIVPTAEGYRPAPFISQSSRRVQAYSARGSIEEPPLFLIHCNFRV